MYFDTSKTNLKAIADSDYDTDMVKSDSKAYNSLSRFCQYNTKMKMSFNYSSKPVKKSCCSGGAISTKKGCH